MGVGTVVNNLPVDQMPPTSILFRLEHDPFMVLRLDLFPILFRRDKLIRIEFYYPQCFLIEGGCSRLNDFIAGYLPLLVNSNTDDDLPSDHPIPGLFRIA